MTVPLRFRSTVPGGPEIPGRTGRSYTRFFEDELGARMLVIDGTGATSTEVLQINGAFADSPGFERALRLRVEEVRPLHHVSLAAIHGVEQIEGLGLCLVSAHTPGRRLSELAATDYGPAFAIEAIRAITPALAMLHQAGQGLAHGTLSSEQIVVASDGQLTLVEHVFGPAIEALRLSRLRLNASGLVVPVGESVRFDARTDMMQLGFLVLSLFLQRPLEAADFPEGIPALLDEFVEHTGSPRMAMQMRVWLERAMQIGPRPFASAAEAVSEFADLPNDIEVQRAESALAMLAFPSEVPARVETPARVEPTIRHEAPVRPPAPVYSPAPVYPPTPVRPHAHVAQEVPLTAPPRDEEAAVKIAALRAALAASHHPIEPPTVPKRRLSRAATWVVAIISLVALGEAGAILWLAQDRALFGGLDSRSPGVANALDSQPSAPSATPPAGAPEASPPAATRRASAADASTAAGPRTVLAPPLSRAGTASGQGSGELNITSAIELQVYADGKLLGSTATPIALSQGTYTLEFVNDALAFRHTQVARVRSGQITALKVAVPTGRVSINATPWAEVLMDGKVIGETPLANLPVAIGVHEVVFRHPRLGERRQTITVRTGVLTRVTEPFAPGLVTPRAR